MIWQEVSFEFFILLNSHWPYWRCFFPPFWRKPKSFMTTILVIIHIIFTLYNFYVISNSNVLCAHLKVSSNGNWQNSTQYDFRQYYQRTFYSDTNKLAIIRQNNSCWALKMADLYVYPSGTKGRINQWCRSRSVIF